MVTYAQQTDPNKAKISSIGAKIETPVEQAPVTTEAPKVGTPIDTKPTETTTEQPSTKQAPDWIGQPKTATKKTTTEQPTTEQAPDWIGQPFVNNAKIVEKKAKAQAVETSKRLATTNASVIATEYKNGGVSAMELQALKESDPLKFQEVSLALEKQNTLDAINQNQEQFMTNYKSLTDKYMQAWEATLTDTTGQELRQKVFEQYGLNKSNEMIKNYTTQIDRIDDELRNLEDWAGTGDAMLDRGELVRKGRDLSRQRMDAVRARQAEVDYYRLGLEQADAVVNDYKQEQGQRLEMMGKQFEMATGMTTMEFEMQQGQLMSELKDIDTYIQNIELSKQAEIEYQRELEKEDRQFEREVFIEDLKFERDLNKAMTMAELNFGYDTQLQKMSFGNQMAMANFDAQTKLGLLRASKELDMMFPEFQFKEVEVDGVKTTVAVNPYNPSDYKAINTNLSKDYFSNIGSGKITSRGGEHDNFQGVDIDGKIGDPIPSLGGKVVKVVNGQGKSSTPSYGNYVDIQDENGYIHRYAHLHNVNVEVGQTIPKGFTLGTVGNSGYTISSGGGDGSHLDYSIKRADGKFMKSSEIPGYLSTLQKPTAIPEPVTELFGILQGIKEGQPGFSGAVGKGFWSKGLGSVPGKFLQGSTEEGFVVGSKSASFAKKVEQVKNILAFDNLDKIKGAMSDKDIAFLKNINTSLSLDMTEEQFNKEVERVENTLLKKYGTTLPQVINLPDFDKTEEVKASSYLSIR